jgi:L-2-hydroxyglutarate oxidase LhgO
MRSFYGRAKENGVDFVFNAEVVSIKRKSDCYEVGIKDRDGISSITGKIVINSAGLYSDKIAGMAGIDVEKAGYRVHYCKGEYFNLNPRVGRSVNRLVYPVPEQAGVGVHITLSLDGSVRLGPNVKYIDKIDYSIDDRNKPDFYQAAHRYLPSVELEDLSPDFAGVRPKLQGEGEGFRDFVIKDETGQGFPGLINLIGVESPGLTASPAIAHYVAEMVAGVLR